MPKAFNILITSISKKVPLIQAVRKSLIALNFQSLLIGGDADPNSIGRYFVDIFWEMPLLKNLGINDLIAFCHEHHIKAIIPTRDAELLFFATNRLELHQRGIAVMVSASQTIELCYDKLLFSQFLLTHHYPSIPTSTRIEDIQAERFVVKERQGAGAKSIGINLSLEEACAWAKSLQDPIFQPYIDLPEYSVDLYVDLTGSVKGSIVRQRDYVVNGESQITSSKREPFLEKICAHMASDLNIYGHAIFQVFYKNPQNVHVIECNARFGGASTLSQAMGLNSFEWFMLETSSLPLPVFERCKIEKKQIRYPADLVYEIGESL